MSPGREDATTEPAALKTAADAGIHPISLPTPFLVGRINCYLIEDEPLTLVDTGPNSGQSLDELEDGLRALGYSVADLGLIVITHQHIDHIGLLEIVERHSGAEVAAFHLLAPYLETYPASAAADDEFAIRVMRRHGVPADMAAALGAVGSAFRAFGASGHVTQRLHDGDEVALRNRTLRVLHRPGHSPSDIVLFDEARRLLIAGDHLLSRISSNPVLSRPLDVPAQESGDGGQDRPHALVDYIASMRATREMAATLTLGGHGPPITNHVTLIDERLRMHERRAQRVLKMLAEGPSTAFDLASRMWGNVAVTQAYLTISEVIGHLDLLIADGAVREDAAGPVTRFAAV